ncbi:MAG TPA: carboxylating nicotinate-nucleotide diphosphorylase [Blastocatellia bacterium]|jgi:nicotinate-nucleotide pyrophosphorylase (carboxylating)|nr:carboxylating nicotinate-nucleotide diphosphorylase [Blastocatellia bacterium]
MELDAGLIFAYASDLLKEDLGRGDVTTQAVVKGGIRARGRFLAKQDFILCGLEIAEAVFSTLDASIQLESRVYDGDSISTGTEFARIEGPATVLLSGERTALNLLQRLSGVATLTKRYVESIAGTGARIVDTRKTTPGLRLLEKYAVSVGGGHNHRFGLDDGVLIKDNHIALGGGVKRTVELARRSVHHLMKIEVEVSTRSQLREALAAGADVIMLDNLSPEEVKQCVAIIRSESKDTLIEASGGVSLETVRELAECGVDMISVGAITHSAPSVDISLKMSAL